MFEVFERDAWAEGDTNGGMQSRELCPKPNKLLVMYCSFLHLKFVSRVSAVLWLRLRSRSCGRIARTEPTPRVFLWTLVLVAKRKRKVRKVNTKMKKHGNCKSSILSKFLPFRPISEHSTFKEHCAMNYDSALTREL